MSAGEPTTGFRVSGECRRCVYHTTGFHCEKCAPGFWGDALAEPRGDCKPCNCYTPGTKRPGIEYEQLECAQEDGQCDCQPHVQGQLCDQCEVSEGSRRRGCCTPGSWVRVLSPVLLG